MTINTNSTSNTGTELSSTVLLLVEFVLKSCSRVELVPVLLLVEFVFNPATGLSSSSVTIS